MKVLFISHEATRTGAPLVLLHLLETIQKGVADISFDVLLLEGGPLTSNFTNLCSVYERKLEWRLVTIFKRIFQIKTAEWYLKLINRKHYDLVYANTVASLDVALDIKQHLNIPLILHVHESQYLLNLFQVDTEKLKASSSIIAVSEKVKSELVQMYDLDSDIISVSHPFSEFVRNGMSGSLIVKPNSIVYQYPGRFLIGLSGTGDWVKSFDILPLVIKSLKTKHPDIDCHFVVLGAIPKVMISRINYDLDHIGFRNMISFVGQVECPLDYYAAFDVFLMISREESFSLVLEEVSLLHKPSILFRGSTGASDWLGEQSCISIPYLDVEALTDAIYSLYSNPENRKSLGDSAYNDLCELYSKESKMSQIINLLKSFS